MIKGLQHVGLSVLDLDRSIDFYRNGFLMEVLSQGTFEPGKYNGKYEALLALKGASGRVAVVYVAALQLELFEFSYPIPRHGDPNRPVCDHGISHFCIDVADIELEYERLKSVGALFHCPPMEFGGRVKATYGRDPDGNVFELIETV